MPCIYNKWKTRNKKIFWWWRATRLSRSSHAFGFRKENLFNVVAIVTRYFGGKKLGKGGLVRAYTRGVSDCLDGNITCRKIFVESKIIFDYNLLGIIENFLNEEKYIIIEKDFLENVRINLYIKKEDFEKFEKKLIDMTSSNIKIEKIDEIMLYED